MKKLLAIVSLILTGCSYAGNVLPTGADTNVVSCTGHHSSWSTVKVKCIEQANEFCGSKKQHMKIISWDTHGVRGWSPQEAELTFTCSSQTPANEGR